MFSMASGQAIAHEGESVAARRESCCSAYHQAVELIGKRWTGAIVFVLMDGPLRFSEVKVLVPDLSDRLLSERMKELESEGIVQRRVIDERIRQLRVSRSHFVQCYVETRNFDQPGSRS